MQIHTLSIVQNSVSYKVLAWHELLALAAIPTLLNFIACSVAIPFLENQGLPIAIAYFLSVGLIVLVPMFFAAIFLSAKGIGSFQRSDIFASMRLKKLSRTDWAWVIGGFIGLSAVSFAVAKTVIPILDWQTKPFFFKNMPLDASNYWILAIWLPYFFFNILGEELFWRGYVMPRQFRLTGRWTWVIQGFLWSIWHLPMGVEVVVTSMPLLFILPLIVQLRNNTSISIIIHALFGAFGFLALAFGLVH